MDDRGRLTAPGSLLNGTVLAPGDEVPPEGSESLAELAAHYGLRPSSARPSLVAYLRLVWQRRHFIVAYATARSVSMYTEARLGPRKSMVINPGSDYSTGALNGALITLDRDKAGAQLVRG